MKTKITVNLQPFAVPDVVRAEPKPGNWGRGEDMEEVPSYPLGDLDPETLDALCEQFRREVFKKAGKSLPSREALGP